MIDHLFYHLNTAPFLHNRFIQRLGISNLFPGFINRVTGAFRTGTFTSGGTTFGSGLYGDLSTCVAAILFDHESRSPVLDSSLSHGSIREPLIRFIAFMMNMGFEQAFLQTFGLQDVSLVLGQVFTLPPNHRFRCFFKSVLKISTKTAPMMGHMMTIPGTNKLDTLLYIRTSMFGRFAPFSLDSLAKTLHLPRVKGSTHNVQFQLEWFINCSQNAQQMIEYNVMLYNTGAMATSCVCYHALQMNCMYNWTRCNWKPSKFKGGEILFDRPIAASNVLLSCTLGTVVEQEAKPAGQLMPGRDHVHPRSTATT